MGKFLPPQIETADRTGLTLDDNELVIDTDLKTLWVGDGSTAGGIEIGSGGSGDTLTSEGALINSATSKATPVDADYVGLMDSAASNILKKLSWANIKATLLTYFGSIYQPLDSDLTTIAGLTATTDSFIQSKASAWASRTVAQVKTDLGLTGTNSGDQTTIVGITGTKAQFDTAVSDGNILYVGATTADVPDSTDKNYVTDNTNDAINQSNGAGFDNPFATMDDLPSTGYSKHFLFG